jgi:PBP1b-binding outer membrane lipoprotein LpoB
MKKIAILASMFAVVTLASCGGGEAKEGENTDSTATETAPVDETPAPEVDTTAAPVDTTATPAE